MGKAALGTQLKIGANAVGSLKSIGGVDISADTIETTTHDVTDGYRTFIQGLKDGGEVPFSGDFDPTDATGQQAILTALDSGAETAFTIVFPTAIGYTWSFNGIVTGFKTGAELEDAADFEGKIKVSGKPTLAASGA